jgi:alpha,alpha-trehalase
MCRWRALDRDGLNFGLKKHVGSGMIRLKEKGLEVRPILSRQPNSASCEPIPHGLEGVVRAAWRLLPTVLLGAMALLFAPAAPPAAAPPPFPLSIEQQPAPAPQADILGYIRNAWRSLGRSMNECSSIADPKFGAGARPVLYLPQGAAIQPLVDRLKSECLVQVERLPARITHLGGVMPGQLKTPGLLYLPNRYVVPGGRFNEMYGWDSYFIIRGLLEQGDRDLARGMIENFFYEIENYGAVLNANRTYYLTRSQPPFLTSMVMAQYAADKTAGHEDMQWLARAYRYSKRDYALWTHAPKLAGRTHLSRYFDVGEGPVPDIADHPEYYAEVADWLVRHPQTKTDYLAPIAKLGLGPALRVPLCDKKPCAESRAVRFTADYYKGDRAMRESGFDISFRFGPFGGSTHHYAPVCLNSLLYKAEMDLAEMAQLLGRPREARRWRAQADRRKKLVNHFLWNAAKGMFFDYNVDTGKQSTYDYATTFYPLWVGMATAEQAKSVMRKLGLFEQPGGIAVSDQQTGVQWDKPYGWAPIELICVEGMRRYGFNTEADRVSKEFLATVIDNFRRDGTIREKYDMVTRTAEVNVTAGYEANIVGFGWTNGVFLILLHALSPEDQKMMLEGTDSGLVGQENLDILPGRPRAGRSGSKKARQDGAHEVRYKSVGIIRARSSIG